MLTFGANVKVALTVPVLLITASVTDKTVGPFFNKQVLVTSFWI